MRYNVINIEATFEISGIWSFEKHKSIDIS